MTNQFTDEQVEAAAKAIYVARYGGDEGWFRWAHNYHPQARAALVAAQGAAPQAESERTPEFESREQELFKHQPVLSMKDAATAAIERVRALETFSITDSYPAWTAVDHDDLLAALDGAPEPEVKP